MQLVIILAWLAMTNKQIIVLRVKYIQIIEP